MTEKNQRKFCILKAIMSSLSQFSVQRRPHGMSSELGDQLSGDISNSKRTQHPFYIFPINKLQIYLSNKANLVSRLKTIFVLVIFTWKKYIQG